MNLQPYRYERPASIERQVGHYKYYAVAFPEEPALTPVYDTGKPGLI